MTLGGVGCGTFCATVGAAPDKSGENAMHRFIRNPAPPVHCSQPWGAGERSEPSTPKLGPSQN